MASYGKLSLFAAGDDGPPQCVLGDAQGHPCHVENCDRHTGIIVSDYGRALTVGAGLRAGGNSCTACAGNSVAEVWRASGSASVLANRANLTRLCGSPIGGVVPPDNGPLRAPSVQPSTAGPIPFAA